MKKMKRIASLLLVMIMVFAMSATAFADGNGSIKIQNAPKDTTYTIYRIFDLESFVDANADGKDADDAYAYKVNSAWAGFFVEGAAGWNYVDIDEKGYVTWKKDADVEDFAEDAIDYATKKPVAKVDSKTTTEDNVEIIFTNLDLGYYLVDSTLGTICSLTTTNPSATVVEKSSTATNDKDVWEDKNNDNVINNDEWVKTNDANIGDTVEFKGTINVQGSAYNYVMHDTMSEGLTFGSVSKVTLNGTIVDSDKYTVNGTPDDGHTFDVVFEDEFCKTLKSGDKIEVYYSATLNSNAAIDTANPNSMSLTYKDKNGATHTATDKTTNTYTYDIPVLKYINGDKNKVLAGAGFKLYRTVTNGVYSGEVGVTKVETTTYKVDNKSATYEIITDATGAFTIVGLDAGTYYLKETTTPDGYNKLDTVITIVIDNNGKLTVDGKEVTTIEVENKTGTLLPSTGGMGTTVFYLVGAVLVLGSAVVLVSKKRMSKEF